ncbi:uncharacterized protein A4U43_C07F10870 [Asparagus officinalis]|uniref:Uncharacterized protein n=1 Tax=Asparagus officinalis TaxID=4686 RepID=A0A5P1EB12_ASPOF|nr:uncharacterized protein A4U43_C07F10870 [Asparagus officinalis]
MESMEQTEEAGASRQVGKKSKRQQPVRKSKCVVSKRPRREAHEAITPPTKCVAAEAKPQSEDDVPLLQRSVRLRPKSSVSTVATLPAPAAILGTTTASGKEADTVSGTGESQALLSRDGINFT